MGIKQYRIGKEWEQEIIKYYRNKGYFAYKLATEVGGTVFDIICIKNAGCLCIEAKHVTGDKLYYISSGISKKYDEIDHFVKTFNTNIYIYVKSDKLNGVYWTTWVRSGELLKKKSYLDLEEDCFKATLCE